MGSPSHPDDGFVPPSEIALSAASEAASAPSPAVTIAALEARLAAAEAKAALADEWFSAAFDSSPVAMSVVSAAESRYVRVNHAMEVLVGRSREEILAADPYSFSIKITHPDDLFADELLFGELVGGKRMSYSIEKRFIRADGSIRWGHLTLVGAFGGEPLPGLPLGVLRFIVVHVLDITDLELARTALGKREEELRHAQRIDGIGRLAGGIAHDFNNLLTVIAGHGEIIQELVSDPAEHALVAACDIRESLGPILEAADRAASLTAQLLAHGRRETVMPSTFCLSEAVLAMQRLLVRVIGSNIETEPSLTASGNIHADQGQVGQVVMNLVLNARDAMPEGGRLGLATRDVVVGASDDSEIGAGDWVALIVRDTGHGMSSETRARIFEPFFTTRGERPGTQGSGLGLATVQRIVAGIGGHISVTSDPGEGSTFTVYFPRATAQALPTRAPLLREPAPALRSSERVLVVEDDPAVRTLVATVLVGAHYRVTAARNGEEALAFLDAEAQPFDLVVTDLMMARVGGAALAKRLHERSDRPAMRMLFISGYSDTTPAELLPFGNLLPKPFTPSQLLAAVRRALDEDRTG